MVLSIIAIGSLAASAFFAFRSVSKDEERNGFVIKLSTAKLSIRWILAAVAAKLVSVYMVINVPVYMLFVTIAAAIGIFSIAIGMTAVEFGATYKAVDATIETLFTTSFSVLTAMYWSALPHAFCLVAVIFLTYQVVLTALALYNYFSKPSLVMQEA